MEPHNKYADEVAILFGRAVAKTGLSQNKMAAWLSEQDDRVGQGLSPIHPTTIAAWKRPQSDLPPKVRGVGGRPRLPAWALWAVIDKAGVPIEELLEEHESSLGKRMAAVEEGQRELRRLLDSVLKE